MGLVVPVEKVMWNFGEDEGLALPVLQVETFYGEEGALGLEEVSDFAVIAANEVPSAVDGMEITDGLLFPPRHDIVQ